MNNNNTDTMYTNEIIAKVFGIYGLGSRVLHNKKEYEITVLSETYIGINYILTTSHKCVKYKEVSLLLTPLDKIADEHAIEIAKIAGADNEEGRVKDEDGYQFIKRDEFGIHLNYLHKVSYKYDEWECYLFTIHLPSGETSDYRGTSSNSYAIFEYLIEQGYAVPLRVLGGKTAIEAKLAFDRTLLNQ